MKDIAEVIQRLANIKDAGGYVPESTLARWLADPPSMSPWEIWTLLSLVRHRERQQFVADTIKYRIGADQDALAVAGALGHPDCPQKGVVPGDANWEYFFHGRGCCLTHRGTGEAIDVDFFDDTVDWIDPFFYRCFLKSLKQPEFVEQRVKSLHTSVDAVTVAIAGLRSAGMVENRDDTHILRVTIDHSPILTALDAIATDLENSVTRVALAAAIGDALYLSELGIELSNTRERADVIRKERANVLVAEFKSGRNQPEVLRAVAELDEEVADTLIKQVLSGAPCGTVSAALEIVERSNDSKWCPDVERFVRRTNPNDNLPAPFNWIKGVEFLFRQNWPCDISSQLLSLRSQCLGDIAILALEFLPDAALDLFQRALRSRIPCNRITAAAALAIIDLPWSRAELIAVLNESTDQEATAECRSALMETNCQESHQIVLAWENRNPHTPETGEFITMREASLRNSDTTIRWEMQELHDRVLPLRSKNPCEPNPGRESP